MVCLFCSISILSAQTQKLYLSSADAIRSWHWDGRTASYHAVENGATYLYIRPFDGKTLGNYQRLRFSSSDNIRSWHWDGRTASYHTVVGGKTVLIIRPFDGKNFGTYRTLPFTSSDNIRSWYWDGKTAVYHAEVNGNTIAVHKRSFDGHHFGKPDVSISTDQYIRGWSTQSDMNAYPMVENGRTYLHITKQSTESYVSIPGIDQKLTLDELRTELAKGGFNLVQTDELQLNQCALLFANADEDDISADFGLLVCATQLSEGVTLSSQLIYGGCDASNIMSEGIGARCEAGVISEDLKVKFPGGVSNFNVKGPAAKACGAASTEMVCANVGATLLSGAFQVSDDRGTGFGLSLEAGIGAGLNGSYEEGILSCSFSLKFIAGASISFSINVEDMVKVLKAGADAFVVVGGEIVAAAHSVTKVLEQAGRDIVEWTNVAFNGAKLSRPLAPGEGYLSVFNQAGYITRVQVFYFVDGQFKHEIRDISAGYTAEFFIPPGSISIILAVDGIATFDRNRLATIFPTSDGLVKAYKFWGTIFDVEYAEVSAYR